ncbi:MAG TPA: hypothetical protein PLA10_03875 [Clostridiales bacterium]|nr:hypothetical protein [Clostridiales bacterium]HQD73313.1 hypothetical protein [Clostridiales bacterium]
MPLVANQRQGGTAARKKPPLAVRCRSAPTPQGNGGKASPYSAASEMPARGGSSGGEILSSESAKPRRRRKKAKINPTNLLYFSEL